MRDAVMAASRPICSCRWTPSRLCRSVHPIWPALHGSMRAEAAPPAAARAGKARRHRRSQSGRIPQAQGLVWPTTQRGSDGQRERRLSLDRAASPAGAAAGGRTPGREKGLLEGMADPALAASLRNAALPPALRPSPQRSWVWRAASGVRNRGVIRLAIVLRCCPRRSWCCRPGPSLRDSRVSPARSRRATSCSAAHAVAGLDPRSPRRTPANAVKPPPVPRRSGAPCLGALAHSWWHSRRAVLAPHRTWPMPGSPRPRCCWWPAAPRADRPAGPRECCTIEHDGAACSEWRHGRFVRASGKAEHPGRRTGRTVVAHPRRQCPTVRRAVRQPRRCRGLPCCPATAVARRPPAACRKGSAARTGDHHGRPPITPPRPRSAAAPPAAGRRKSPACRQRAGFGPAGS